MTTGLSPRLVSGSYRILPIAHLGRCARKHLLLLRKEGAGGAPFKEGTRCCEPATGHRHFLPQLEGPGPGKDTCSLRSTCDWLSSDRQGQWSQTEHGLSQTLALTSCVTLGKGTSSLRLHFLICRVKLLRQCQRAVSELTRDCPCLAVGPPLRDVAVAGRGRKLVWNRSCIPRALGPWRSALRGRGQ